MSNARQNIIDAMVSILKTGVPAVSNRVIPWRKTPLTVSELPAILVYDQSATVELLGGATNHTLSVTVVYAAHGATTASQAREALQAVSSTLFANNNLNGTAITCDLQSHDIMTETDGDITGAAKLEYNIIYRTALGGI